MATLGVPQATFSITTLEDIGTFRDDIINRIISCVLEYHGYTTMLEIGTRRGEYLFRFYDFVITKWANKGSIVTVDTILWEGRVYNYLQGENRLTLKEAAENSAYVASIINTYSLENITRHVQGPDEFFSGNTSTFDFILLNGAHGYAEFSSDLNNAYAILNDYGSIVIPYYNRIIDMLSVSENLTKAVDEFSDVECRKKVMRTPNGLIILRKMPEAREPNQPMGYIT